MKTLTRNAAPANRPRTMNLGQALLGQPLARRRPHWYLRIDLIVACALATVPQDTWRMT